MSDNIKVVVKVRPLITREIEEKLPHQWRVKNNTLYQLDHSGKELGSFTFDKVYDENTKTNDVYNDIAKPIVEAAVAGFNGTIFAYGQTSSGKTYTMTGTEDSPGIITLAVLDLFEIIKNIPDRDFLVRVSYIEIYNETLKDLLDMEKENLKIYESFDGIKVDATEKVTSSPEEVLDTIKQGEVNRQTGSTNMNEKSSRSHSIFKITIESREHIEGQEEVGCVNVSQLNLVDLAGSERAGQTGATGKRFKEGTHINKSLSALALVIKQLSENPTQFTNFRNSKLTRILQNSLGGNAKTSIICAVTPAAAEETISTLQFGNRAKSIKNEPIVNAVANRATMIQDLTKKLGRLQSELESKKHLELDNYNLQKQIAGLRRVILSGVTRHSTEDSSRRKLPQRRITISALSSHSVDDATPMVPRFCTPVLKYNPLTLPDSEFSTIQRAGTLSSVPEEPPRLITPPPTNKRVNFENEVIELDSDDDTSNLQTCSPIHDCYNTSKTPPCILRKSAKQAEKNLKDIVELTDREKMYPPKIAELLKQLEEKTCAMTILQDEMDVLKEHTKQKDILVEHLKKKVQKTEETVKSLSSDKQNIEEKCKDFEIKLTDWEVSYDTLRKKAKLREDDLLSIVDELRQTKSDKTGTLLNQSLKVSDDTEKSNLLSPKVSTTKDEAITRNLLSDLKSEIAFKSQAIIELEANLVAKNQRITFLEKSSQELQDMINSYKEKLLYNEEETSVLKNTIENLSSTIKSQKINIDNLNDDIKSYNSVIQELQTGKDININLNLSTEDDLLQNMIQNEEKLIANNENIKNIIHAFKIRLEDRDKEIAVLKSTLHQNTDAGDAYKVTDNLPKEQDETEVMAKILQLEEQIKDLMKVEKELSEKLDSTNNDLTKSHEENVTSVAKILQLEEQIRALMNVEKELSEKLEIKNNDLSKSNENNLAVTTKVLQLEEQIKVDIKVKRDLSIKLTQLETKHNDLLKLHGDNLAIIDKLKGENTIIGYKEIESKTIAENLTKENSVLKMEIDNTVTMITNLQEEINSKENVIKSLQKEIRDGEIYIENVKSSLAMIQKVHFILSDEELDLPTEFNGFLDVMRVLMTGLNSLEGVALDLDTKTKLITEDAGTITTFYDMYVTETYAELETLRSTVSSLQIENYESTIANVNLDDQIRSSANKEKELEKELNELNAENEYQLRQLNICRTNVDNLELQLATQTETNDKLNREKMELEQKISELSTKVNIQENTIKQLDDTKKKNYKFVENMFSKVSQIASDFNITNQLSCDLDDESENTYEKVILILEKITNHITYLNTQINETQQNDHAQLLWEAKTQITDLTEQNINLSKTVAETESKFNRIATEMQTVQANNEEVTLSLKDSSTLLDQLKDELKQKSDDIVQMKSKVLEWKNQFEELDSIMKQQKNELKLQTEKLLCTKAKYINTEMETQEGNKFIERQSEESISEKSTYSPKSLVTICCGRILESIPSDDSENVSTNSDECDSCKKTSLQLSNTQEENTKLTQSLQQLRFNNQQLLEEQEQFRLEIQQLVEPALELQKKIVNHKTNLSILTATTYAENKLLNSQVKSLQHHHSRFHQVCQRDLPAFKRQLCDLLGVLKDCPTIVEAENLKRFSLPDVLDKNTTILRNESVLDGDLLMLDTNVTLTTADNTLVACEQTCLDLTQNLLNEISMQTNDINQTMEVSDVNSRLEILNRDNQSMFERLEVLKEENKKLRKQLDDINSKSINSVIDAQSSPIKIPKTKNDVCQLCLNQAQSMKETNDKFEILSAELINVKEKNATLENKYQNLVLEIPATDALVSKLNNLVKESHSKENEIKRLTESLKTKSKKIQDLQEENDTLSNQVMESITENDNLNKEVGDLKKIKEDLTQKCTELEKCVNSECSQCLLKDTVIQTLQEGNENSLSKVKSSNTDLDSSRRYNKICTLQSELNAGREDCKELCEDFTSIKNHLEFSSMSMDLDESIDNAEFIAETKSKVSLIPEEQTVDVSYETDKINCLNYYKKVVGEQAASNFNENVNVIDVMKMLYNHLLMSHSNEVENLVNKLKNYEQDINNLQALLEAINAKHETVAKELETKNKSGENIPNIISQIKNNLDSLSEQIIMNENIGTNHQIDSYKEQLLAVLDAEYGMTSVDVFEIIIGNITNKHQIDLDGILEKYNKVQEELSNCTLELKSANEHFVKLSNELTEKEKAYNLLSIQKENIHEISNAVTLDIVKKEKELNELLGKECKKLSELNLVTECDMNPNLSVHEKVAILFDHLIKQHVELKTLFETEKARLSLEINSVKTIIQEKDIEINDLKQNSTASEDSHNKMKSLHEELTKLYNSKAEENQANLNLITKLTEEINVLKLTVIENDKTIQALSEKDNKLTELIATINNLRDENNSLKTLNDIIVKEKETQALELETLRETIKQNNEELEKMKCDILILNETIKENTTVVEQLKEEAKLLLKQNLEIKEQYEQTRRDCSRLETNIKTHEKTADIQNRMIIRLQKQKEEDDLQLLERERKLNELTDKYEALKKDYETIESNLQITRDELIEIRKQKDLLECRVTEFEYDIQNDQKPRTSLDNMLKSTRRRRQSLHDSKRIFGEQNQETEENNLQAVFESRDHPDDLFMDVDEHDSNRSTPIRLSKGRDSLPKSDHSELDEEHSSRPNSVMATRRKRHSIHDLHRSVIVTNVNTSNENPTKHDDSKRSTSVLSDTEVSQLKEQLFSCQKELEDLKERYKELDDECETCAEYLRERDEQCARLKKEKTALEREVSDLKEQLRTSQPHEDHGRRKFAHVAVNTDEDWANLHSVVVDRMSYDAEVEKNKRLVKTVEELRFKKQELKNITAKMQKALEKYSQKDKELELKQKELEKFKNDIQELKQRNKELDDECGMCAEYLKEKDEHYKRLKETKIALETKLAEYQKEAGNISHLQSVRKKRQSMHDQNRSSEIKLVDVSTEIGDDFLSNLVERDHSLRNVAEESRVQEIKHLKTAVNKLTDQKIALEKQVASLNKLPATNPTMFVATGSAIVQNQQITDVMKENQKLKKINAKLINLCKKRDKTSANRENEDPSQV